MKKYIGLMFVILLGSLFLPIAQAGEFFDAADTETIIFGTRTGGTFNNCIDTSDDIDCIYQEEDSAASAPSNLNYAVGSFGTTTQAATNTVTISGWNFDPTADTGKFAILWWDGTTETTDNNAFNNHKSGYGIAVSSTERGAVATHSENGVTPPDSGSAITVSKAVLIIGSAEATDGELDFVQWTSDGMRFVIDDAFTANYTIQYHVASGDDIINVATGTFQWNIVTGTQDITGLGFQGELLIVMAYDGSSSPPATSGDASLSFGIATDNSAGNQYAYMGWANDASAPSDTFSYVRNNELLALGDSTIGPEHRANFDSWLAGGFRINIIETDATIRHSLYLVINGGQWKPGDINTRTDTMDIVETGVGFQPDSLLFLSHNRAESASDTPDDTARWSMGATNHTAVQQSMAMLDEDNKDPTEVQIAEEYNEVYINIDEADTAITRYLRDINSGSACGDLNKALSNIAGSSQTSTLINTLDTTSPYFAEHCWSLPQVDPGITIPAGTWTFNSDWGTDSGGGPSATFNMGFYECEDSGCTTGIDTTICELTAQNPLENTNDQEFSCSGSSFAFEDDNWLFFTIACNERCTSKVPTLLYDAAASSTGDSFVLLPENADPAKGLMNVKSFDSDGFTAVMSDPDPVAAFVFYLASSPDSVNNYTFNMTYDWVGVPAANNHTLIIECTRLSATENVGVFIFNFTSSTWVFAYLCDSATDVTYNTFILGTGEYNSGAPRIRFNGTLEATDTVQDSFTIDYAVIHGQTIDILTPELQGADMLLWFLLALGGFFIIMGGAYETGMFVIMGAFCFVSISLFVIYPSAGTDTAIQTAAFLFLGIGIAMALLGGVMEMSKRR